MEAVKQYEIWLAELPKPAGRRPVLLLTRDGACHVLNKFIAAEITTTIRGIPIEVSLGVAEGMPKACVVNFDSLRTIPKNQLAEKIGRILANKSSKSSLQLATRWDGQTYSTGNNLRRQPTL